MNLTPTPNEPMTSPISIRIRQAELQDAEVLVGFSAALAWETEGRKLDLGTLMKGTRALMAASERGFFILAEHDEGELRKPVGQLMITFEWSDWRNGMFWWVQSVYVAPPWRRRGIYRFMHHHIVERAKADPAVCGIRLYVEQTNQAAQSVYQRVGLAPSGYWVYEQDFVLPKTMDQLHTTDR
jgi:ribosomal protein S18 acetylase RimI-like enzyme